MMPAGDRITAAVAGDGRHLLDSTADPRVRLISLAEAVRPDLIVFPCSRFRRFENVASVVVPEGVRRHVASGQVGLVFDASLEGVAHKPDITAALHAVIRELGAQPGQCMYVTQDRQYETGYRAHCREAGIEPVNVLTHDYWIWYALSEYAAQGDELFESRLQAFRARGADRARRFVSLNRTPRPTKILFLLRILRDHLWDQGFVSFGGFRGKPGAPGKDRPGVEQLQRALPGFEDLVADLAPQIETLDAYGRVVFGAEQHGWERVDMISGSRAVDLAECDRSWFTIVTETEMRARPSRITEKVIKPLVNFHPLLVLGNPGALPMIRSYGFQTFDDVFDESYDEEPDPRRRFDRVYDQFVAACRKSDREWNAITGRIQEKLVFNARRAMTRLPGACRREHDMAMVDRMLRTVCAWVA
jgi:hypothetical protein